MMKTNFQVLIIGAGAGGIMAASQLMKKRPGLNIGIIDPADMHYYQPAWTLVGANAYKFKKTGKPMKKMIPKGVTWIKEHAEKFEPENNKVFTKEGTELSYQYLVVAPGLKIDPTMIEGLAESLGEGVVCSNYTDPEHTWEVLKNFKGGNALFTQPTTPIKCGGAPQKIAYLAADYLRKNNLSDKSNVIFATPGSVIFGVKPIAHTLMHVVSHYDIHFKPFHAPIRIDGKNKKAYFNFSDDLKNECVVNEDNMINSKIIGESTVEIPFEMLHIAPPQRAPDFVKNSPLALESGWLDVDKHTLQSNVHKNIFGLGDICGVPTAKTAAAIRKQAPVVVENIVKLMEEDKMTDMSYNGYSSCPLVTGYGKMVLAEFDYDKNFTPDPKLKQMLVFNSDKEHWRLWMLKKHILPHLYWNKMMKGQQV